MVNLTRPRCVQAVCEAEKNCAFAPYLLRSLDRSNKNQSGHVYVGQELASEYHLDQGQELAHDEGQNLYVPQYGDKEGLPHLFKTHAWEPHCPIRLENI
jgi:hypothetical protein